MPVQAQSTRAPDPAVLAMVEEKIRQVLNAPHRKQQLKTAIARQAKPQLVQRMKGNDSLMQHLKRGLEQDIWNIVTESDGMRMSRARFLQSICRRLCMACDDRWRSEEEMVEVLVDYVLDDGIMLAAAKIGAVNEAAAVDELVEAFDYAHKEYTDRFQALLMTLLNNKANPIRMAASESIATLLRGPATSAAPAGLEASTAGGVREKRTPTASMNEQTPAVYKERNETFAPFARVPDVFSGVRPTANEGGMMDIVAVNHNAAPVAPIGREVTGVGHVEQQSVQTATVQVLARLRDIQNEKLSVKERRRNLQCEMSTTENAEGMLHKEEADIAALLMAVLPTWCA